jgi:hypothetical protein
MWKTLRFTGVNAVAETAPGVVAYESLLPNDCQSAVLLLF